MSDDRHLRVVDGAAAVALGRPGEALEPDGAVLAHVRSRAEAAAGAGEDVAALLGSMLRRTPPPGPDELVEATTAWTTVRLGTDASWLQAPGPLADRVAERASETGGVWAATAGDPGTDDVIGRSGALAGAAVLVDADYAGLVPGRGAGRSCGALVTWSRGGRTWTAEERGVVDRAAVWLGSALQLARDGGTPGGRPPGEAAIGELRDHLVTTVSHELRTPLSTLSGGLELLLDGALGELTPQQQRLLERMDAACRRLGDLADNASRLGAVPAALPGAAPGARPVDACAVLTAALDACAAGLAGRDLELSLDAPGPRAVPVLAPAEDLRGAVDRLLDNAVKFTPDGGRVVLRVRADAGTVHVEVVDDGPGIAPHELARVGRPFFRSVASRTEEKQGAGLGLAVARGLAESWGGALVLDSAPGRGTRVVLRVPAP